MSILKACILANVALGSFVVYDPSDVIDPSAWAADNALLANYSVPFISVQGIPNVAPNEYRGKAATVQHKTFSVDKNDTSVVVVTEGSDMAFNYDTFIKEGYSSNLLEASFYGVNAAVWVGNGSTAVIENSNVTVHNGAANIFVYGTGSVVEAKDLFLYASGPVSHGIYGAGNGTIHASNVQVYTGGYRSSAFSGDNPAGYVHVKDSVAHTDGVGSAICYALGLCNLTNVIGHAANAPTMFMDSNQEGIWTNCDLTAGRLAGMVLFGSQARLSGAKLTLDHTKLTVLEESMASLWFGNTIASVTIESSTMNNTVSDIFVIANTSQVTQDFTYFAGGEENPSIQPAEVTLTISESPITGDLVAYNGSTIDIAFKHRSSWTGAAKWGYGSASIDVHLDASSNWTLTGDSKLDTFRNADKNLENVFSEGYSIYYNASAEGNSWITGTVKLKGGGKLRPVK